MNTFPEQYEAVVKYSRPNPENLDAFWNGHFDKERSGEGGTQLHNLVFADYLEENGEPGVAHFIRTAIDKGKSPALDNAQRHYDPRQSPGAPPTARFGVNAYPTAHLASDDFDADERPHVAILWHYHPEQKTAAIKTWMRLPSEQLHGLLSQMSSEVLDRDRLLGDLERVQPWLKQRREG